MLLLLFILSIGKPVIDAVSITFLNLPEQFVPGRHHVLLVKITNTSSTSIRPETEVILPKGWQLLTQPSLGELNAGASQRLLFTVALDAKAAHGNNAIDVLVKDRATKAQLGKKNIAVKVKKTHLITLELYQKPTFIKGGEEFECSYLVENRGNVDEEIKLSSRQGTLKDNQNLTLAVGASKVVHVNQQAPKISNQPQTVINDLVVHSAQANQKWVKKTPLTAFPTAVNQDDVYYRYPLDATWMYDFIATDQKELQFLKYNIKGNGFLDREEKHHLKFIAKGTNRAALERFENYTRYMVHYKYDKFGIALGDFTLTVSRLLERIRLGRGILYEQKASHFNFNVFYNKLRFFPEIKDQFGGSVFYSSKPSFKLGFHSIWRNFQAKKGLVYTNSFMENTKPKVYLLMENMP